MTTGQQFINGGEVMSRDQGVTEVLVDAMWAAFEAADNCYADRVMDVIDTGGTYESFSMSSVAAYVLEALADAGYTVVMSVQGAARARTAAVREYFALLEAKKRAT